MGASNKFFLDKRETDEHEKFDHNKRFNEKVKQNWLTTEDFRILKNADLFTLTESLIDKKMDLVDYDRIIEMIELKEPKYIAGDKGLEYIKLISKTPINNMTRVFKKYDGINFFIKSNLKNGLELLILNHG